MHVMSPVFEVVLDTEDDAVVGIGGSGGPPVTGWQDTYTWNDADTWDDSGTIGDPP